MKNLSMTTTMLVDNERALNFSAGPSALPMEVLEEIKRDLFNWNGLGLGVMEMSHRSKSFYDIISETKSNLRKLLNVPDNYDVIFTQSGGTGAFSHVVLNFLAEHEKASYLVSGYWSRKAYNEAMVHSPIDLIHDDSKLKCPTIGELKTPDDDSKFVYYCSNETIVGLETLDLNLNLKNDQYYVVDASSHFLSRPMDISKYGVVFSVAQKNSGIAGLTIYIVRKDLYNPRRNIPGFMNLRSIAERDSILNTPPTFPIYVCGLVIKWIMNIGGLEAMEKLNIEKSSLLYDYIDSSNYYFNRVDPAYRSRMNVSFYIGEGRSDLETLFKKEAEQNAMLSLGGHSSVGGLRASIYNAIKKENVQALIKFMESFKQRHALA